ncbi:hypothetical protein QQ045_017277 [Rhodiola kirilowii]
MKGFTRVKWGDESVVKVSQLNEGIFLFKIVSEVKKMEVLSGGPWTFDNRPLILKPWSEEEEYKCGSVEALPVWIHLPRLKAHLADTIILSTLYSRLGLKEREQRERERKDKRDVCEDEIECDEETAMDKEQNGDELEPEESVCVLETQMNPRPNAKTVIEKEGNASFVPYLSKSAQKRARQKVKRDSNSGESNGQGDTVKSTSSSHTRMKEKRVLKIDIKAKQFEKMRRETTAGRSFGLIVVYASNSRSDRKVMWEEIEKEGNKFNGCWLCMGDFNCVRNQTDKLNGSRVRDVDTSDFRVFLRKTGLEDDMADAQSTFLPPGISDHSLVMVYWGEEKIFKRCFRYCNFWETLEGYDEAIRTNSCESRRAKSNISHITLGDGTVSSDSASIKQEFSRYFRETLGEAKLCSNIDPVVVAQGPLVSGEQCRSLVRSATDKEIWSALVSIGDDKAPGPDGFSARFFKNNWSILGKELCEAVRHCLRHNALPKGANAAFLVLIPKSVQACKPEDFRPIACCNVAYKIVSSLLASRLKEVLPDIINSTHGAFIKDRSIVGNICLAQQLLLGYSRRNINERLAWKIDLRKAYDTIDWKFLTTMLENLKFPSKFIAWMVMCVQSTSYSIMINGEMVDFFEGKRGLRQDDPLSPFLFIIAMEGLSRMLQKLNKTVGFYYHPKCHKIKLSHIMCADNLILFSSGRNSTVSAIKEVVYKFLECSGLSINVHKSNLFTGGMGAAKVAWVEDLLGTKSSPLPVRYLGLPLTSRSLCKKECDVFIQKITAQLDCWSNRYLSRAGRRVLVASVLQAMAFFWARVCIFQK